MLGLGQLKGKKMRRFLIITVLLPLLMAGCTQYARMEEVKMGMPLDEFLQLPTPCYYRATLDNRVQYSCRFNVRYGESISTRVIRPYIMTFEDGVLSQIAFDEQERTRQLLRNQYHYRRGYWHGYGYRGHHFRGHCY